MIPCFASAAVVTIAGYDFNLDQFQNAAVTTSVGTGALHGTTFDQWAGIDQYTLGELASDHFGGDFGDRISLGNANTQEWLNLDYGTSGIPVGSGQGSLFAVYESNGDESVDPEGQNFEIAFNGGSFVSASNGDASVVGYGNTVSHNQIVFDLTDSDFGFSPGDIINSVEIRNLTGSSGESDPDFTFAARAGEELDFQEEQVIPEPASLLVWILVGLIVAVRRWR
jgi:hypothetical protein